ncbi:MAG: glycosyl transferase [Ignavibacteriales bacterium]|nr:glycosyl transferase [Ignavibacteriales bacterium]
MTRHFCTLFDSNYLSRGLAMYRSLLATGADFRLYVFAFDERTRRVLDKLRLDRVVVVSLADFEDEKLLAVKPTRSVTEYCWTSSSSTVLYVLENFDVDWCVYLDADLFFYADPEPIFEEAGEASIILTEHRYSPKYDKEVKSGRYCVQFTGFRNDERGLAALRWWRERTLEWCYARHEDGKFGDQKYLDDWTERFEGVHVVRHMGAGVAAWNVRQYDFRLLDGALLGRELATGEEFQTIFYHFHYLRYYTDRAGRRIVEFGRRDLSPNAIDLVYAPYLRKLEEAKDEALAVEADFDPHGAKPLPRNWKTPLLYVYRKLKGVHHLYPLTKFGIDDD